MTKTYKKYNDENGNLSSILMKEDGQVTWSIPLQVGNRHYDEYLEWAKTNTTEEADGLSWNDIRLKRDGILKETDWTMTTGSSVDQSQWAAYRQNLRDLPQTYKDKTPDDVVWPTQPSTKGPNS
jgi:hypothetical protein